MFNKHKIENLLIFSFSSVKSCWGNKTAWWQAIIICKFKEYVKANTVESPREKFVFNASKIIKRMTSFLTSLILKVNKKSN